MPAFKNIAANFQEERCWAHPVNSVNCLQTEQYAFKLVFLPSPSAESRLKP
jgi:hypothetical protein